MIQRNFRCTNPIESTVVHLQPFSIAAVVYVCRDTFDRRMRQSVRVGYSFHSNPCWSQLYTRVDPVSLLWGCCIHQQSPKSSLTPTRGDHIEFDVRMSQLKENRTLVSMCGPTATCIKIPMKFRFLTHGKALIAGQLASGTRVRSTTRVKKLDTPGRSKCQTQTGPDSLFLL